MVLHLIGLGLGDAKDITVRGLELVRAAKRVYLEAYTSILCFGLDKSQLEKFYGRELIIADRDMIEQDSDRLLDESQSDDVCLLVVGDPFGATTHCDLVLRAKQRQIPVKIVHNASILNAVGCCGLQLYSFGETVSLCMWTDDDSWQPDSYFDKIVENRQRNLHTLCLLDIKIKEQTIENLIKGRKIFEPPRYMSCADAAAQLLQIIERRSNNDDNASLAISSDTRCIALARIGWPTERIVYATLRQLIDIVDMGDPLHSLIIPADRLHPIEQQMLDSFAL